MADGSVVIGVSLDTAAFAASVAAVEMQVSRLGLRINNSMASAFASSGIDTSMNEVLGGILRQVGAMANSMAENMKTAAQRAVAAFADVGWNKAGEQSAARIADGIAAGSSHIIGTVRGISGNAASAFNGDWSGVGRNMMAGVAAGILSAGFEVVEAVRRVSEETDAAVREYFEISSPSALMRDEVGVMISRGIAEGITSGAPFVGNALNSVYSAGKVPRGAFSDSSQRSVTQNIYLRDDDSSPYRTARRIKREGEAIFRQ